METPKYDPSKGLSAFDKVLVRGFAADKSAVEVSAMTNGVISPAAALARISEILEGRTALSEAQKQMLLTDDLMALKDVLYEKAVEFKSLDHAKPLLSVLTLIDKRLSGTKFDLEKAMTEINAAHAQLMLAAISLALERSFLELEKRYPDLRKAELLEVFHAAMPDVVKQIESRVPA